MIRWLVRLCDSGVCWAVPVLGFSWAPEPLLFLGCAMWLVMMFCDGVR